MMIPVPLVDALSSNGGTKTVETLDGKQVQVDLPIGVIKPGSEVRVSGHGMPRRKHGSMRGKGDLVVKWNVVFPDGLTASQKEQILTNLG